MEGDIYDCALKSEKEYGRRRPNLRRPVTRNNLKVTLIVEQGRDVCVCVLCICVILIYELHLDNRGRETKKQKWAVKVGTTAKK